MTNNFIKIKKTTINLSVNVYSPGFVNEFLTKKVPSWVCFSFSAAISLQEIQSET